MSCEGSESTQSIDQSIGDHSEFVNIKVVNSHGNELNFRLKTNQKMGKLMKAYCNRNALNKESVRFIYDGVRIHDEDTPERLELEEGAVLEVFSRQEGGC